jgi:putative nucleotidyltransferase with HDIG domain
MRDERKEMADDRAPNEKGKRERPLSVARSSGARVRARAHGAYGSLRRDFAPAALLSIALVALLWAVSSAPHSQWGLAALLGAATLLDVLAGDVLRAGRRIVAPGLVVCVAAFVLYGTPAAVIVGCARGIVRVLSPKPMPVNEASCVLATAVLGPLLGGLSANAITLIAPLPLLSFAVYIVGAYTIEAGLAMLLLSRISRPSVRLSFEQTFGWTMLHFAVLGALGVWLGKDLAAGHWIALAYFAVPIAVIRQGFDVFNARAEKYVAALEVENTQLFDKIGQLDRVTGDLAEAVGMAIDCRDGIEQNHSHRVARLAVAVGGELGLTGSDLEVLRRGALLHDVGTLAIPAEIFAKPGPLTPTERRRMQLHTEFGARFVNKWRDCRALGMIIEQHHERLDGSGYPRNLKGDQIILEARIVGAVEAYVALTSDRPQRRAYSHDEAMRMLRERAPREYDSSVVEALASVAGMPQASVLPLPTRRNG